MNDTNQTNFLTHLKEKFPTVTDENLGSPIKDFVVDLNIKEGTIPIYSKARPMVNYCAKFLPKLSDSTILLTNLLRKGQKLEWTEKHDEAFIRIKNLLLEPHVLEHFDIKKPIAIFCDASNRAISKNRDRAKGRGCM